MTHGVSNGYQIVVNRLSRPKLEFKWCPNGAHSDANEVQQRGAYGPQAECNDPQAAQMGAKHAPRRLNGAQGGQGGAERSPNELQCRPPEPLMARLALEFWGRVGAVGPGSYIQTLRAFRQA